VTWGDRFIVCLLTTPKMTPSWSGEYMAHILLSVAAALVLSVFWHMAKKREAV